VTNPLVSALYLILDSHKRILRLFGRILELNAGDRITDWKEKLNFVEAQLDVHRKHWKEFSARSIS
jgi:hypothetical protein